MKKFISLALALLLIFSIGVSSFAAPIVKKVQPAEKTETDKQIDFIFENLADLSQDSADGSWVYAITDLDHNGNLELVAGICKAPEYYTYAKVFEVSPELDSFIECDMSVEEGKPFVDILQDSADTYYDKANDTWYYLFSEDFTSSTTENYAVKCSVSLKDGYVTPKAYATEHCEIVNGVTAVTYEDMDGNLITPEEFNNAGANAFKGFEKSGTNFSWFSLKDAKEVSVLTDSYKVFTGDKEVKKSEKTEKNNITIVSAPKDNPFLMITKNPTSENCFAGDTVYFVTGANNATSYTWYVTSPDGTDYSLMQFQAYFSNSVVSGGNSPTLSIQRVVEEMNGWGAYCICAGNNQTARSSTAYINVSSQPYGGAIAGTVSDYLMSSVTIVLNNGTTVQVLKDICNVVGGSLDYGCYCTCYYSGAVPTSAGIYRVDIQGKNDPVFNSTTGSYVASGTDGFAVAVYVPMVGTTLYVSPSIVNYVGNAYDGCSCTVYFTGNIPTGNSGGSIYQVDVYGLAPSPQEDYTWTCDVCGAWNRESSTSCATCGTSRYSDYTWTCNVCGAWNKESSSSCTTCGTSRYSDYTWTCNICGAWNKESSFSCTTCGASRYYTGLIEEPVINTVSGWTCSNCGTWNDEFEVYCCGCGMSHSGTGFITDALQ